MEEMNFEEMRNQFAILKEQLDKQEIVSDRLLRETMKAKSNGIRNVKFSSYLWCSLGLIFIPILYFTHMTSLVFIIATYLMVVVAIVSTYYLHKPIDKLNFMKDDIATIAHVMAEYRKQYTQKDLIIALLVFILWYIWFCYEIWKHLQTDSWVYIFLTLFGGIQGGISGYKDYRKAKNAAQEIIDDIEKN